MTAAEKRPPQNPTPLDDEPYDAGNPEHVARRSKQARQREDLRATGLVVMMKTTEGRAFVRHLLVEKLFTGVGSHVPPDCFTGNSATFYNAGQKRVGDVLKAELFKLCRPEYRLMEDEGEPNG